MVLRAAVFQLVLHRRVRYDVVVHLHLCDELLLVPISDLHFHPRARLSLCETPAMHLCCKGRRLPALPLGPPTYHCFAARGQPDSDSAARGRRTAGHRAKEVVYSLHAELLQVSRTNPQSNTTICTSRHRNHICFQSLQLCHFFISRKQGFPSLRNYAFSSFCECRVFHLRNYAFSSSRENKFSIFATMPFLHFAKLFFRAKQP